MRMETDSSGSLSSSAPKFVVPSSSSAGLSSSASSSSSLGTGDAARKPAAFIMPGSGEDEDEEEDHEDGRAGPSGNPPFIIIMGQTTAGSAVSSRKVVHNASSKVSLVVQRMLLPIIQTPLRSHVVFDVEEDQVELDLIEQLGKKNPEVLEDSTGLTFIQHLQGLFDRYNWWRSPSGAYSRVAIACPSSSVRNTGSS